jgi:hypothetical protein
MVRCIASKRCRYQAAQRVILVKPSERCKSRQHLVCNTERLSSWGGCARKQGAHGCEVEGCEAALEAGSQAVGVDAVAAHNVVARHSPLLAPPDQQVVCYVVRYVARLGAAQQQDILRSDPHACVRLPPSTDE